MSQRKNEYAYTVSLEKDDYSRVESLFSDRDRAVKYAEDSALALFEDYLGEASTGDLHKFLADNAGRIRLKAEIDEYDDEHMTCIAEEKTIGAFTIQKLFME